LLQSNTPLCCPQIRFLNQTKPGSMGMFDSMPTPLLLMSTMDAW
jgi:hypothetical protein